MSVSVAGAAKKPKKTGLQTTSFSKDHFSAGKKDRGPDTTRLIVRVIDGGGLLASDLDTGKSDPVCFLWCGPLDAEPPKCDEPDAGMLITKTCPTTLEPIWDEEMIFPLGVEDLAALANLRCIIYVRDEDEDEPGVYSFDELGMVELPLKDVIAKGKPMTNAIMLTRQVFQLKTTPGMQKKAEGFIKLTASLIFSEKEATKMYPEVADGIQSLADFISKLHKKHAKPVSKGFGIGNTASTMLGSSSVAERARSRSRSPGTKRLNVSHVASVVARRPSSAQGASAAEGGDAKGSGGWDTDGNDGLLFLGGDDERSPRAVMPPILEECSTATSAMGLDVANSVDRELLLEMRGVRKEVAAAGKMQSEAANALITTEMGFEVNLEALDERDEANAEAAVDPDNPSAELLIIPNDAIAGVTAAGSGGGGGEAAGAEGGAVDHQELLGDANIRFEGKDYSGDDEGKTGARDDVLIDMLPPVGGDEKLPPGEFPPPEGDGEGSAVFAALSPDDPPMFPSGSAGEAFSGLPEVTGHETDIDAEMQRGRAKTAVISREENVPHRQMNMTAPVARGTRQPQQQQQQQPLQPPQPYYHDYQQMQMMNPQGNATAAARALRELSMQRDVLQSSLEKLSKVTQKGMAMLIKRLDAVEKATREASQSPSKQRQTTDETKSSKSKPASSKGKGKGGNRTNSSVRGGRRNSESDEGHGAEDDDDNADGATGEDAEADAEEGSNSRGKGNKKGTSSRSTSASTARKGALKKPTSASSSFRDFRKKAKENTPGVFGGKVDFAPALVIKGPGGEIMSAPIASPDSPLGPATSGIAGAGLEGDMSGMPFLLPPGAGDESMPPPMLQQQAGLSSTYPGPRSPTRSASPRRDQFNSTAPMDSFRRPPFPQSPSRGGHGHGVDWNEVNDYLAYGDTVGAYCRVLDRGTLDDLGTLMANTGPKPHVLSPSILNRTYEGIALLLSQIKSNPGPFPPPGQNAHIETCLLWVVELTRPKATKLPAVGVSTSVGSAGGLFAPGAGAGGADRASRSLLASLAPHTRHDLQEALQIVGREKSKRGLLASLLSGQLQV